MDHKTLRLYGIGIDEMRRAMINNTLLGQDSTTSPSGRSGFANHQNRNWAALGESMNRIFGQMQATLGGVVGFAPRTQGAVLFVVMCGWDSRFSLPQYVRRNHQYQQQLPTLETCQGVAQPVLRAAASKSAQQEAAPQQRFLPPLRSRLRFRLHPPSNLRSRAAHDRC